jgi:sterol desaturase/sphingolipid hydroxylase (fatty acid hydroxylase superfamily)
VEFIEEKFGLIFGFAVRLAHSAMGFNVFFVVVASVISFFAVNRGNKQPFRWQSLADFILPPEQRKSASLQIDVFFYLLPKIAFLKLSVISSILVATLLQGYVTGALTALFEPSERRDPNLLVLIGFGILAYLVRDFTLFFSHMMQHRIPVLWEFHKIHHSATNLNPLTSVRFHPVEFNVDLALEGAAFSVVLGVAAYFYNLNIIDLAGIAANILFLVNFVILAPLQHSNVPISFGYFDRFVITPTLHHLHHSSVPKHYNRNFGSGLSIWDRLFGTLYIPGKGETIIFGLGGAEQRDYDSAWRNLFLPFVRVYMMLFSAGRPRPAQISADEFHSPIGEDDAPQPAGAPALWSPERGPAESHCDHAVRAVGDRAFRTPRP